MRGPGVVNSDLAIWKEFDPSTPLNREKTAIQFRIEAYNAFNNTNYNNPNTTVNAATAAVISSLQQGYLMRRFQFGIHVAW